MGSIATTGSSPRLRGTVLRPAIANVIAVHPRACGERACLVSCEADFGGSSPRLRGTGRTSARSWRKVSGSSPRLRGTGRHGRELRRRRRFIPAPAGTADKLQVINDYLRFIPAPAGNGPSCSTTSTASAVHPRACGERVPQMVFARGDYGSSPRLRGTDLRPGLRVLRRGSSPRLRGTAYRERPPTGQSRFIPAPAGNGRTSGSFNFVRGRFIPAPAGNGSFGPSRSATSCGSSPRLRGTDARGGGAPGSSRFIPAPAGNGALAADGPSASRFIPAPAGNGWERAAGVASSRFIPARAGNGPRGKRDCEDPRRFIPARAGNGSL